MTRDAVSCMSVYIVGIVGSFLRGDAIASRLSVPPSDSLSVRL